MNKRDITEIEANIARLEEAKKEKDYRKKLLKYERELDPTIFDKVEGFVKGVFKK